MFDKKTWTITHDFDQFWAIFDPELKMHTFGVNQFWAIFDQKAWIITHDFDPFFAIFEPKQINAKFLTKLILGHV